MRHGTEMNLQTNYVDSHGASFIGFGITGGATKIRVKPAMG
jgi:TnpA family transposase